MGQKLSRVYGSLVKRPLQRYNVEHRAEKVLSKIENPEAPPQRAPMYQSDKDLLDNIRNSNPALAEATHKKDGELFTRLRDVYVTSTEREEALPPNPERPLPLDRAAYSEDFVPGLNRQDKSRAIPRGKVTLDQAVQFISDHNLKPAVHTAETISDSFRINPAITANTLKYFKIFKAMTPEKKNYVEFDPLTAGKDWVEDTKEHVDYFKLKRERDAKIKMLKEKEAAKKKQTLLADGSRDRTQK